MLTPDGIIDTRTGRVLFKREELACKGSGLLQLAPGFAEALAYLRVLFDRPMSVNSCCRSAAHNRTIGGHARSLHVCDDPAHPTGGAAAIDIASRDTATNLDLVRLALPLGWSVGVAKWGIHLDRRVDFGLPQGLFGY